MTHDEQHTRLQPLFTEGAIARRVEELADEIATTINGDFVVVGLLKGSFVFVADLVRALDAKGLHPRIEFMRLSSYGLSKQSAGEVQLIGDVPVDVTGAQVLLVDDIVDTGRSLAHARGLLEQRDVKELWTCALIDKPSRREVDIAADFVGFAVGDVFVAGYGIDYAEQHRHLPYIGSTE